MAKATYRLETVLELRTRKKEEAERRLGECIHALETEKKRQAEMEKELERMIAKREERRREFADKTMRGEMSAQDTVNSYKYIEYLKELEKSQEQAIAGQKEVVRQRQEDVDAARKELIVANQELKALEKHKEKWAEQIKRDIAAKEEEAMDELAQSIFLHRDEH